MITIYYLSNVCLIEKILTFWGSISFETVRIQRRCGFWVQSQLYLSHYVDKWTQVDGILRFLFLVRLKIKLITLFKTSRIFIKHQTGFSLLYDQQNADNITNFGKGTIFLIRLIGAIKLFFILVIFILFLLTGMFDLFASDGIVAPQMNKIVFLSRVLIFQAHTN